MEILILGGNGQLGRYLVHAFARARAGHAVTCLARGTQPVPDVARFVRSDRDRASGLRQVAGHPWDVIVDLATQPGHVRRAVAELTAQHWIYMSSVSAYERGDVYEQDEESPTHAPLATDSLSGMEDYGPAKAACEEAVRSGTPSSTLIRPGLISGSGDDTGRSGYYPWRFAHAAGEDVLVPDDREIRLAMIDVKDLVAWIVHVAGQRIAGTFNATGPRLTLPEAIEAARRSAGSSAPARPVPSATLSRAGVRPWMGPDSLPWWIPDPGMRFAVTADTRRAQARGLRCRPLEHTLEDALAYEKSRGGPVCAGLSDDTERRIRSALAGEEAGDHVSDV